ncbi:hypothetical protein [Oceanicoccus sagamiensis]|uniref:Lipoprotein n=1 Tax=Oceanicoccus sagamiensis TaxID=716816 RepID=A0A1X9NM90_9GAMM|nr:hypothetical protein [Oceanicoccus sagamiensis]ARN75917.1 hypothetical protein BST96_18525 [Oceanicoccus sagamiensis]
MSPLKRVVLLLLPLVLVACGGGGGGGSGGGERSPVEEQPPVEELDPASFLDGGFSSVSTPENNSALTSCAALSPVPAESTLTGRVFYQRVPLTRFGLDYSAIISMPMRGVVVEAVDASNGQCSQTVLATTLANANGEYGLSVDANQAVCVQVRAQLFRDGGSAGASWNIQLTDNTAGNAPYYLLDNTIATPAELPLRDLLAGAGVEAGFSDYTLPRSAAPFAILDSVCEALDTLVRADSDIEFPLLAIRWSELNNAAEIESEQSIEQGDIGGSFYRQQFITRGAEIIASTHEIFLLGDEDSNTDEYDPHVITHEFAHYLTGSFGRYDALGGPHSIGDHLDLRLALEEGWADAFSGIALERAAEENAAVPSNYRNSLGIDQSRTSRFALDASSYAVAGWYSEASVASIMYNLFDTNNDGADELSLGFSPIFQTLTSPAYRSSDSLVSLFTFINQLKQQRTEDAAIDLLVASQDTEAVVDDFGSDEDIANNDIAADEDVATVYTALAIGSAIDICSNNQYGTVNKLAVNQFLLLDTEASKNYRFTVTPGNGVVGNGRAVVNVYRQGEEVTGRQALVDGSVLSFSQRLDGSTRYIMTLAHADYLEGLDETVGRRCFSVLVE